MSIYPYLEGDHFRPYAQRYKERPSALDNTAASLKTGVQHVSEVKYVLKEPKHMKRHLNEDHSVINQTGY